MCSSDLSNTNRQQVIDYSGRNTLVAVDDDVGDYKILRVERASKAKGQQETTEQFLHS